MSLTALISAATIHTPVTNDSGTATAPADDAGEDGPGSTIVVRNGMIEAVGTDVAVPDGAEVIDLTGWLVLPAAIEPHAHLDKVFLAEFVDNPTGDLYGAIEAMRANRHLMEIAPTVERAERAARTMARNGFTTVRTHADVTLEHGIRSVEALTEVKRRVADVIDVEIVALCGWPVSGPAGADQRALLRDAMAAGADLVGGCPHLEEYTGEGTIESATDVLLGIAADLDRGVDLHTDETLDPAADGLDLLARRVLEGFALPATASHCVSLGQQPETQQRATAERVAEAGVGVVTLPHTNLYLQGRGTSPMPRALTAIGALRDAGVAVAAGADNVQDPFNPLGRLCPFETAALMILANHDLPTAAWAAVSTDAARVVGGRRHTAEHGTPAQMPVGLAVGAPANLLAVPSRSVREAVAWAPGATPCVAPRRRTVSIARSDTDGETRCSRGPTRAVTVPD